jgi:hypothetical protein
MLTADQKRASERVGLLFVEGVLRGELLAPRREALGLAGPSWWRHPQERIGEPVWAESLQQEFAASWAEGRALALEDAIKDALEETSST